MGRLTGPECVLSITERTTPFLSGNTLVTLAEGHCPRGVRSS